MAEREFKVALLLFLIAWGLFGLTSLPPYDRTMACAVATAALYLLAMTFQNRFESIVRWAMITLLFTLGYPTVQGDPKAAKDRY